MFDGNGSVNLDAKLAVMLRNSRNGQIFMRHQDSAYSGNETAPWSYISTVEAESTAKIILRVAGVLTLGSLLLGFLLPTNYPLDALDVVGMSLAAIAGVLLIFFGPRALHTTAKVGANEVALSTTGFRVRLKLQCIESIAKSNFPSGGYGYRLLGKGHRGFISGGPQVDIRLNSGREYTVSVESEDAFISAVARAKHIG